MHVVEHAGHYDFLSPCSEALARQVPEICTSEPGFDRTAFHVAFDREIVAFFDRTLQGTVRPDEIHRPGEHQKSLKQAGAERPEGCKVYYRAERDGLTPLFDGRFVRAR